MTGGVGFLLACLGIVADSQLQAGAALSPWLSAYLLWGLPVAPAVMALGALLVHELDPGQLRRGGKQTNGPKLKNCDSWRKWPAYGPNLKRHEL